MDHRCLHPGNGWPAVVGGQPGRPTCAARLAERRACTLAIPSVVAAQADTAEGLIAARAAMGVGAAVIFPTTLALITNISPTRSRAPRPSDCGPPWSASVWPQGRSPGWLLAHFAWGAIFLVNVPVAAAAIVGGWLFVPTSRDPATPPVDVGGLILSAIGVTALVYTVIEAPNWGWSSARTIIGFTVAGAVLVSFAIWGIVGPTPYSTCQCLRTAGSPAVASPSRRFLTLFGFIFVITPVFPIHQALRRI